MNADDIERDAEKSPLPEDRTGKSSDAPAEGSDSTPPPTKDSPGQ